MYTSATASPRVVILAPVLLVLLGLSDVVTTRATTAPADQDTLDPSMSAEAFSEEDECLDRDGSSGRCALNAIQLRRHSIVDPKSDDDETVELRRHSIVDPKSDDDETEDDIFKFDYMESVEDDEEDDEEDLLEANGGVEESPLDEVGLLDDAEHEQLEDLEVAAEEIMEAEAEGEEREDKEAKHPALLAFTPFDKIPVTGCHKPNGTVCPAGEKCIVKQDNSWSQCVSCSRSAFGKECQKFDDFMRYAAVRSCKRTCLDSKCYNQKWCHKPYRCLVDKKEQWGQCVSCKSNKFWKNSCYALKKGLLKKASKVCHRRCKR